MDAPSFFLRMTRRKRGYSGIRKRAAGLTGGRYAFPAFGTKAVLGFDWFSAVGAKSSSILLRFRGCGAEMAV
jgi:hypothetical protein